MRGYSAFVLSEATLLDLENDLNKLRKADNLPAWDRATTIAYLDKKGPLGTSSGQDVQDEKNCDPVKKYILDCVTAYTWTTKVPATTMKVLSEMWSNLPSWSTVPSPYKMLVHPDGDPQSYQDSFMMLQLWCRPFAVEHMRQLGQVLLDGLAAIRHQEGCEEHFKAHAKLLALKGVKVHFDNR